MVYLEEYCKTCGMCCKYPLVLPAERERIVKKAGFLKERHFKDMGGYFVIDKNPCPFLEKGKCRIEEIKPDCCKVFPLVLRIEKNRIRWVVSDDCPISDQIPESYIRKAKEQGKKVMEFHRKRLGLK